VKCIFATAICVSVCVSVCLSLAAFPHYCTDQDVTWENGRGCALVVHYWADLQSVHGFQCYDNTHICKLIALYTTNAYSAEREMSGVLVLAVWLVLFAARQHSANIIS